VSRKNDLLQVSLEDVIRSAEFLNFFPTFDFKFYNGSRFEMLISKVELQIRSCAIDLRPCMEIELICDKDGNLCIQVNNYGWGNARQFHIKVDLSRISQKLGLFEGSLEVVPQTTFKGKQASGSRLYLVRAGQLQDSEVNAEIRAPALIPAKEREYGRPAGGVVSLPGAWTYTSESEERYRDSSEIERIQRGAYDWSVISFKDGRFIYVPYDDGIRYSLKYPSVSYHALLDPGNDNGRIEISTALTVPPKSFERAYFTLGSTKSASASLDIGFYASSGSILKQRVDLEIWNPRNSYFSRSTDLGGMGVHLIHEIEGEKLKNSILNSYSGKMRYNVDDFRKKPTIVWGY